MLEMDIFCTFDEIIDEVAVSERRILTLASTLRC